MQVAVSMLGEPKLMLLVSKRRQEDAGRCVHAGRAKTHAHGKYTQTGRRVQVAVSMLGVAQLMLMVSTHRQEGAGRRVHAGRATTHAHGKYTQAGRCRSLCPCWERHNLCS